MNFNIRLRGRKGLQTEQVIVRKNSCFSTSSLYKVKARPFITANLLF